MAKEVSFNIH